VAVWRIFGVSVACAETGAQAIAAIAQAKVTPSWRAAAHGL
jgi:hypothetical protein